MTKKTNTRSQVPSARSFSLRPGAPSKYPWTDLKKNGDMMFVSLRGTKPSTKSVNANRIRSTAFAYAKSHKFKIVTRIVPHPKTDIPVLGVYRTG